MDMGLPPATSERFVERSRREAGSRGRDAAPGPSCCASRRIQESPDDRASEGSFDRRTSPIEFTLRKDEKGAALTMALDFDQNLWNHK
jgi:hypothetical protein